MANKRPTTFCCVPGCNSLKWRNPEVSFHKFPNSNETVKLQTKLGIWETVNRRETWKNKFRIGKKISEYMKVCSLHFNKTDFFQVHQRKKLKRNVVPSKNLPNPVHGSVCATVVESTSTKREERLQLRNQAKQFSNLTCLEMMDVDNGCENAQPTPEELEAADGLLSLVQSEDPSKKLLKYRDFEVQVNTPAKLTLFHFITGIKSVTSLTGLNSFTMLNEIVASVKLIHKDVRLHKLTIEERVVLTFVKLKCDLSYAILGVLFGVNVVLCKTIFVEMLGLLSAVLKGLIVLPYKAEISRNMPLCFQNFLDTEIVLDCTEIFVQTPKCLCCRVRFYSHYKGAQTIKFMTGVSPAGLITFISKAYGGRASDKVIFEESGLITKLHKNSAIMVDKGFLIEHLCTLHNIKLYRPPFLHKKNQLDADEANFNKEIAAARVHIERTNQRLKIFKIFGGKLQWNLVPYVDDIMTVICGITNLSAPILANDKFIK